MAGGLIKEERGLVAGAGAAEVDDFAAWAVDLALAGAMLGLTLDCRPAAGLCAEGVATREDEALEVVAVEPGGLGASLDIGFDGQLKCCFHGISD